MSEQSLKVLIVYYSLEGNTKLIGQSIANAVNADIFELETKKEIKSQGFMKYFWGGKQVMMKEQPELLPFNKDIENYDILFLGTPVWAWNYAPAFNTFFSKTKLKNKKIALFCCHGGQKGKTFANMKKALEGNQIIGEIDFLEPLKKNRKNSIKVAKEWAEKIITGLNG